MGSGSGNSPDASSSSDAAGLAAARQQLAEQIERNVDALEQAMAAARRSALSLDSEHRGAFQRVSREVGAAARELHKSLLAAQRATNSEWDKARATLATDYDAYAQAVAQAQRIAVLSSPSDAALTFGLR